MNISSLIPEEGGGFIVGSSGDTGFSTDIFSCLSAALQASALLSKVPANFPAACETLRTARLLLHHFEGGHCAAPTETLVALRALLDKTATSLLTSGQLLRSNETSCSAMLLLISGKT